MGVKGRDLAGGYGGACRRSKSSRPAGCWWLVPVILASWEADIRRIEVRGQPRQIVHETLSPK
jgi:hypothetical protein